MAATEMCFLDQSSDGLNVDELLNIDTSLLMSFLDDSLDGGVLRAMIQSLDEPAESMSSGCSETTDECRFSEVECCSISSQNHPDFEWMDMEMDYFNGRFTGNVVEFGGIEDYSSRVCYGMDMEEDDYIGLWQ